MHLFLHLLNPQKDPCRWPQNQKFDHVLKTQCLNKNFHVKSVIFSSPFSKIRTKSWNFDGTSAQIWQKLLKKEKVEFWCHKGVFTNLNRNLKNTFVGAKFNLFFFQEFLFRFKRLYHQKFRILLYFLKKERKKSCVVVFLLKNYDFYFVFFFNFSLKKYYRGYPKPRFSATKWQFWNC